MGSNVEAIRLLIASSNYIHSYNAAANHILPFIVAFSQSDGHLLSFIVVFIQSRSTLIVLHDFIGWHGSRR